MNSIPLSESFLAPQEGAPDHPDPSSGLFQERYGAYRPRLRFLTRDSSSYCESFHVDMGLIMLVMNVGLEKPFEARLRGQNIIEFHYRLAGSLHMSGAWGTLSMDKPSMLLWYQPEGYDDVEEVIGDATDREMSISLYCDAHWLSSLTPEYSSWASDFLTRSRAGSTGTPVYRLYSPQQQTFDTLQEIVRNPFQDRLRYLYAKGKALELLCQTIGALGAVDCADGRLTKLRARDQRSAAQAREILLKEFAAPPSIDQLARRVGVNEAKLLRIFKHEYGETMSDFVRVTRLQRARQLLSSSDLQVKQIAQAVGYHHHSSFTAAFTQHYGVPPKRAGRLRPSRR